MRIRRIASAALVVALAAALTGCGGSDDKKTASASDPSSSKADEVKVLSDREAKEALITLDDLGDDFKVDNSEDDDSDDDGNFGCLENLKGLDENKDIDAKGEAEIKYEAKGEIGIPGVFATIGSLESADDVKEGIESMRSAVKNCKVIDITDKDGFRLRLKVVTDEETSGDEATAQFNFNATGTGSGSGITFPFAMRMSLIQVENNIAVVGFVTAGTDIDADADALNQLALKRLAAAAAGEDQPDLDPLELHVVTQAEMLAGMSGSV